MVQHRERRESHTPRGYRSLAAVKMLLFALFGLLLLGQCLTQGLHATPFIQTGMGCHDDCWYQRPSWQPVAVLQHAPALLLPPEPSVHDVWRTSDPLIIRDDHGHSLPPRSPPTA